jgi:hypothetical protein
MQTYVAEIKGVPVIAFQAKSKAAAKDFVASQSIQDDIRAMERDGKRVWDGKARIRVRSANRGERQQLVMGMLSVGLIAKRIDINFWVSLITSQF